MKKIISILIILLYLNVQGQDSYLVMSNTIEYAVDDFIVDMEKRGFTGMRFKLMEAIDVIAVKHNFTEKYSDDISGVSYNRTILLNPYLVGVDKLLKSTLYHEIGHLLRPDKEHYCPTCLHIMSEYEVSPQEIVIFMNNPDLWDLYLDSFAQWLKF